MKSRLSKYRKQNVIIISIFVAIFLLMFSVHMYHVKQEQDIEQNARQEIALWIVHHYKYKEPIKEMDFTSFSKPSVFGDGGYAATVLVNGNKKDSLFVSVNDIKHPIEKDGTIFAFSYNDAVWKESKDKRRTLDHIKIGSWSD